MLWHRELRRLRKSRCKEQCDDVRTSQCKKLQSGASYYQTGKYLGQLRVFSEIFVERDAPRRVQLPGVHGERSYQAMR
jgi:hypothetical protein